MKAFYARYGKRSRNKLVKREIEVMENLLKQEPIELTSINQLYYADITFIPTREGWLYLAAVMDAYSRRIVGYAMNDTIDLTPVEGPGSS